MFVSYDRYSLILRRLALSVLAYVVELFVVDVSWSQVAAPPLILLMLILANRGSAYRRSGWLSNALVLAGSS